MLHRANRKDNGEEVIGSLVKSGDCNWFIFPRGSALQKTRCESSEYVATFYEIIPESLAMETTVLDKNKKMIFGSILVEGKMSEGGDTVRGKVCGFDVTETAKVCFIDGAFYPLHEGEFYWSDIEIINPNPAEQVPDGAGADC